MSNVTETYNKSENSSNPNATSHYVLIAIAVVIGFAGVILRFLGTWALIDVVSNILLIIGVIIALKAVFNILK